MEQYNHNICLLNDLAELLQGCLTLDKAVSVIGQALGWLFAGDSGTLFIASSSLNLLEAVAVWGEGPPAKQVCAPDDCRALRCGQTQTSWEGAGASPCVLVPGQTGDYLCKPLISHGVVLGLLQVLLAPTNEDKREGKLQLAIGAANLLRLTLANLKLQEALHHQNIRDPLTGLFNCRYLSETLEREFLRATRQGTLISLIVLDIDHFKRCNDTYGHDAGDSMLREVSAIPQRYIRDSDVVYRYEGDKFVIMLPECSPEIACRRAEEMRQAGKTLQVLHDKQMLEAITLSFGVAAFPDHGDNPDTVLMAAVAATYRAKQEGRDRVVVADWSIA